MGETRYARVLNPPSSTVEPIGHNLSAIVDCDSELERDIRSQRIGQGQIRSLRSCSVVSSHRNA